MPDPLRKTISATEASALFEASPYVTPWMLYRRFAHGEEAYTPPNARMDWGTKMEPLILEQAAQDLKFEIRPNRGPDGKQVYVRNGLLGCTRDADIYCPQRGPGVCEVKCVFDYRIWMQEWDGGNRPPRHHEIQVQTQMKVGEGEGGESYRWGVEVAWVAGELHYFERDPIPKFWDALDVHARQFFDDVAAAREPAPFGTPREYPLLREVFPTVAGKVLDMRDGPDGRAVAEQVRLLDYHCRERLGHTKGEDALALKLGAIGKDCDQVLLPNGISFKLKQNKTGIGIKVFVPDDVREGELFDGE